MIVYLHGFNSSPASGKAEQLGAHMAGLGRLADYDCPALPNSPREAIAYIEAGLARHQGPVTLIGSSLGGFYATHLAEKHGCKAVLVNPAVHAHVLMRGARGAQTNWHTGEKWELTEAHLAELAALDVDAITRPERYLLLAQTGDEVIDYRDAVAYYAGATQIIEDGGNHGFAGFERHFQTILDF
ncbi:MAG TPA: YqiA/YcfP family alpha/beta fold hydrolase [Thiobacillus sp.]|nr:YqiA/YcfP family alpha/beta fold hydrolase [Thiobacillus sp.]